MVQARLATIKAELDDKSQGSFLNIKGRLQDCAEYKWPDEFKKAYRSVDKWHQELDALSKLPEIDKREIAAARAKIDTMLQEVLLAGAEKNSEDILKYLREEKKLSISPEKINESISERLGLLKGARDSKDAEKEFQIIKNLLAQPEAKPELLSKEDLINLLRNVAARSDMELSQKIAVTLVEKHGLSALREIEIAASFADMVGDREHLAVAAALQNIIQKEQDKTIVKINGAEDTLGRLPDLKESKIERIKELTTMAKDYLKQLDQLPLQEDENKNKIEAARKKLQDPLQNALTTAIETGSTTIATYLRTQGVTAFNQQEFARNIYAQVEKAKNKDNILDPKSPDALNAMRLLASPEAKDMKLGSAATGCFKLAVEFFKQGEQKNLSTQQQKAILAQAVCHSKPEEFIAIRLSMPPNGFLEKVMGERFREKRATREYLAAVDVRNQGESSSPSASRPRPAGVNPMGQMPPAKSPAPTVQASPAPNPTAAADPNPGPQKTADQAPKP